VWKGRAGTQRVWRGAGPEGRKSRGNTRVHKKTGLLRQIKAQMHAFAHLRRLFAPERRPVRTEPGVAHKA
jgi:hypothetical protein